jgi:hypothetical protein
MSLKKMPFISSVQLIRIDGSTVIPTTLYYDDKKPLAGKQALEYCSSPELLVEDFKLELGLHDPDSSTRRSPLIENTPRRTPVGLLKDFLDETLRKVDAWLVATGLTAPTKILIAEPLSLAGKEVADENWLSYYRKSLKKVLQGKFAEIDFMPEPFAVFQYYRYGLRHPLVSEQRKHVALVLDFGGGTFDVSVVETTKGGELSGGGVNSRPLGARSIQVGGFYINRRIAEELLFSVLDKKIEKAKVRKSLAFFYDHKNDDEDFVGKLGESERCFFKQMKELLHAVELAKVTICNSIAHWSLSTNLSNVTPYSVSLQTDPFSTKNGKASARFDAGMLQKIYLEDVWPKLRDTINITLDRASRDLSGQPITVVLLSGGSSNIRWLRQLIDRDLRSKLIDAQILELSENFQEIVAKGLATECARRHYTGGRGDFRAVTYNRLCLLLKPDDGEFESKHFRPTSAELLHDADAIDPNILLPVASSLRGLVGQRLQWRVKPSRLPKRALSYYFMRSSFDAEDLDARHNIVETKIFTPPGTKFQQYIVVELVVREDGTAEPRFIYGKNDQREGTIAAGKPFYIDMTFAAEEISGETYLGFDFGSSTSACSYVSSENISWIEERSRTSDWRELSELVSDLPYPVAAPLARYMSEMEPYRRLERGREAIEAMLALLAYTSLAEISADKKPSSSLFKGMAHRSAGPLWGLLKQVSKSTKGNHVIVESVSTFIRENGTKIDMWINDIASLKHGKVASVDFASFLTLLGNTINKMFESWRLGVFEGVTRKRFSQGQFRGIFRNLTGSSQTFIHVSEYEGSVSFADEDVYLINIQTGAALSISPFYLWGLEQPVNSRMENDLFEYDTAKSFEYLYKSVQSGNVATIEAQGSFSGLYEDLRQLREREQPREIATGLSFTHS